VNLLAFDSSKYNADDCNYICYYCDVLEYLLLEMFEIYQ
jgi:hypothetical protein